MKKDINAIQLKIYIIEIIALNFVKPLKLLISIF